MIIMSISMMSVLLMNEILSFTFLVGKDMPVFVNYCKLLNYRVYRMIIIDIASVFGSRSSLGNQAWPSPRWLL